MTKEEAIVMQKAMRDNLHETGKDYPYRDDMIPLMKESCDIAIKALEQESCDNCISRQAAIDAINHICPVDTEYDCALLDRVDVRCVLSDLPSVAPAHKKGNVND